MERSSVNTSDSLDDTVTDVPDSLLDFAISDFVETLYEARAAKKVSAKIHHAKGQSPKFMVVLWDNSGKIKREYIRQLKECEPCQHVHMRYVQQLTL